MLTPADEQRLGDGVAKGRLRNKAAQTPREAWNCANSYRQTWFITTGQNIRRQSEIQKIHQTQPDIREEKTLVLHLSFP